MFVNVFEFFKRMKVPNGEADHDRKTSWWMYKAHLSHQLWEYLEKSWSQMYEKQDADRTFISTIWVYCVCDLLS